MSLCHFLDQFSHRFGLGVEFVGFTKLGHDRAQLDAALGLIMAELVKANELHAKPEQVRTLVEEMAQSYEDPSELVDWYYAQPERLAQAEAVVIEDNVVAWVSTKAQATDKDVAFDELMGNAA